jgi:hypothetical protein
MNTATRNAARIVLAAAGIALGVFSVVVLRSATLSTHDVVPPDSQIEVVVSAQVRRGEGGQTLEEMVEAQLVACRLEVNSDVVGEVEPLPTYGYYRAVLQPSMDETNRRQFRGCLEDWKIDQFQLDVIRLAEIARSD